MISKLRRMCIKIFYLRKTFVERGCPEYSIYGKPIKIKYNQNQLISQLWSIYKENIGLFIDDLDGFLNPPAEMNELDMLIKKIENKIQKTIPKDFKELYLLNNGNSRRLEGIFLGLNMMSVSEIEQTWDFFNSMSNMDLKVFNDRSISLPDNKIKKMDTNINWIPIATDICGNYIGFDLDPDFDGISGQIINFGRDEYEKVVISRDLKSFIILLLEQLSKGNFTIEGGEEDKRIYLNFNPKGHPIEKLKQIAKSTFI